VYQAEREETSVTKGMKETKSGSALYRHHSRRTMARTSTENTLATLRKTKPRGHQHLETLIRARVGESVRGHKEKNQDGPEDPSGHKASIETNSDGQNHWKSLQSDEGGGGGKGATRVA
jgi:hypothetical protein